MRSWSGKEMQQSLKTSKELFDMSQKLFKHSHWDKSEILRSGCMFTQVQMARVSRKCVLVILIDFACSSWLILHVHLDWFCMFIVHWGPNDKGQQGRKYVLEILIDLCKFELFLSFLGLIRLGESLGWCSCTGAGSRLPAMLEIKHLDYHPVPPPTLQRSQEWKHHIIYPNKPDSMLEVAHMGEAVKSSSPSAAGEDEQEPAINTFIINNLAEEPVWSRLKTPLPYLFCFNWVLY